MTHEGGASRKRISLFLHDYFMVAACVVVVAVSLLSARLYLAESVYFGVFVACIKLITAIAVVTTFKSYRWDVSKGLVGGALFCLMYQEGYFVLVELLAEQNFDVYLIAGLQGSVYLAAAAMSFLMIIIIVVNHFFIGYARHGNPKNVILSRIAIVFELAICVLQLVANASLGLPDDMIWLNALQSLGNIALLLLIANFDSQVDDLKVQRSELLELKRREVQAKGGEGK